MEKISSRIDIPFKKIFGVEENKDLLISLINSIEGRIKWFMIETNTLKKVKEEEIEKGIEQTAINMLNKNTAIEFISEVTGFSKEEIQKLKLRPQTH